MFKLVMVLSTYDIMLVHFLSRVLLGRYTKHAVNVLAVPVNDQWILEF